MNINWIEAIHVVIRQSIAETSLSSHSLWGLILAEEVFSFEESSSDASSTIG